MIQSFTCKTSWKTNFLDSKSSGKRQIILLQRLYVSNIYGIALFAKVDNEWKLTICKKSFIECLTVFQIYHFHILPQLEISRTGSKSQGQRISHEEKLMRIVGSCVANFILVYSFIMNMLF